MKIIYKSFYILAARGFSIFSSLISAIILATYLGPELRGQYAIIIAAAVIIFNFFCFGLKEAFIVLRRNNYNLDKLSIDSLIVILWFVISIFSSASLVMYIHFFMRESLEYHTYILIAGYIFTSIKIYFLEAKLISNGNIIKFSYLSTADKLLKTIAIFIMVVLYDLKIDGALFAIIFSNIISAILYFRYCNFSKFRFIIPAINEISLVYKLALPYGLVIFFTNLINNIDLILINVYHSHYKVGLYVISLRIIDLLLIFCQSVCFTIFADTDFDKKKKSKQLIIFKKLLFKMVIFYIITSICLLVFIDELVIAFFGMHYEVSSSIVYYLLPSMIGIIIYKLIYHFISKDGPNNDFIIISVLALIFNILLNYFLIPIYGMYGAAISKSITFLTLGSMSLFIFQNRCPNYN